MILGNGNIPALNYVYTVVLCIASGTLRRLSTWPVGTGAAGMLGGGACAVLVPYDRRVDGVIQWNQYPGECPILSHKNTIKKDEKSA
jgi:hypothetical protein